MHLAAVETVVFDEDDCIVCDDRSVRVECCVQTACTYTVCQRVRVPRCASLTWRRSNITTNHQPPTHMRAACAHMGAFNASLRGERDEKARM